VATRRWILFLLAAAILALAGCNSGSTFNVQNPPPPPPPNISIAFQPAPIGTILIDTTTNLTAVVSNDPSNSGVSWSVTCSVTGNCGQLSAQHTASGDATTYTPPASLAGNSLDVNIVAFATASQATNVVAPITVTAFGSNLKGTYVLEATGADSNFNPYQFAGVIVLDGNGGISSGEQTVISAIQPPAFSWLSRMPSIMSEAVISSVLTDEEPLPSTRTTPTLAQRLLVWCSFPILRR